MKRASRFVIVAAALLILAGCSNRQRDPDTIEHMVGRQVHILTGYLNRGQFDSVATMLHPDAPEQWRKDIRQMPLVQSMLSGKVINVRGGKIQPDIFQDDQRAPILLFSGRLAEQGGRSHLAADQLGTTVTIWRPDGGRWALVGVEQAK